MKEFIKDKHELFLTALAQVFFVAMQPLLIVHHKIIPMLITGFVISLIWTFNVKKVAFGSWSDRLTYAVGAMIGTGLGFMASDWMVNLF